MAQQPPKQADYCLGMLPLPNGLTQACSRRNDCERYVYRHHSPAASSVAQWLCPGADAYWPAFQAMGAKACSSNDGASYTGAELSYRGRVSS